MGPSNAPLIPSYILILWQATGLLPQFVSPSKNVHLKRLLRAWTLLIILVFCYFYTIELNVFIRTYRVGLNKLEFFTMILCIYREFFFILPIVMLIFLFVKSEAMLRVVKIVDDVTLGSLEGPQRRTIRWFHVGSWVYAAVVVVGAAYANYAGIELMLAEMKLLFPDDLGWVGEQRVVVIPGGLMSYRLMAIIYGHAVAYTAYCWTVPPLFLVGMVLALGYGFANLGAELKEISKQSNLKNSFVFDISRRISRIRDDHRQLRSAVNRVNNTAAFIIILSTIGDVIMPVSLVSQFLTEEPKELGAMFTNHCMKYGVYFFSACTIVQGILRISVFVWMHEQASSSKVHLRKIVLSALESGVKDIAKQFEEEMSEDEDSLSISGNGFFAITKHFAATLFGVILTYYLLIYETKDEKNDLDELQAYQEMTFVKLTAQIQGLINHMNKSSDHSLLTAQLNIPG
ncbi:hypothetical protein BV898_06302 [Hypsibius exemplaris]|uniref:Gustatory receptor n=1 Tax=Hypsibius exemplaris TaxID=2072580 RepID=A0A1W0WX81_HYPEX|nr:hypothetical protein BV898_06302 [Hypsibius exemplaris]